MTGVQTCALPICFPVTISASSGVKNFPSLVETRRSITVCGSPVRMLPEATSLTTEHLSPVSLVNFKRLGLSVYNDMDIARAHHVFDTSNSGRWFFSHAMHLSSFRIPVPVAAGSATSLRNSPRESFSVGGVPAQSQFPHSWGKGPNVTPLVSRIRNNGVFSIGLS